MSGAFGGSEKLKQQVLTQLESSWQQGKIHAAGAFWQAAAGSGTLCGCAVRGNLNTYVHLTTVPASLALMADSIAFDDNDVLDIGWARQWFGVVTPGAELYNSDAKFVSVVLAGLADQLNPVWHDLSAATQSVMRQLILLHASPPCPARSVEWQALQQTIIDLRGHSAMTPPDAALGELYEALCWAPAESVTLFVAMLAPLRRVQYLLAQKACGWNEGWQEQEVMINRQFEQCMAGNPDQTDAARQREVNHLMAQYPDYFRLISDLKQRVSHDHEQLKSLLLQAVKLT